MLTLLEAVELIIQDLNAAVATDDEIILSLVTIVCGFLEKRGIPSADIQEYVAQIYDIVQNAPMPDVVAEGDDKCADWN